jgi:cobalt transporter subunit CbtA
MAFLKSILISALIAGFVAGAALTGLQTLKVYPLIFAAEEIENAGGATAAHDHGDAKHHSGDATSDQGAVHSHDDEAWMPADGAERLLYSLLSNVLLGIALGLILAAIFALRHVATWRQGVVWGLAGFIAVNLAPALGLPPELPGMPAGALLARQTWWLSTALFTAGGIAMVFLCHGVIWRVAGVALIALPHIYGAPHPVNLESAVPATLAADFTAASLATNLVFWTILGLLTAEAMARVSRGSESEIA